MLGDSSITVLAPPPPTSTASASSSGGGGGGEPPPSQPPGITEEDKGGGIRGGDEGGGSGGDRSFGGGKRWPRQETLALLKIRSDMDVAFRDASLKGPLWEEVSRKLAELGYNRSAKKCKEKFENVYKYHKRTKEGRTGKQEGKTYRFFDQLEAFETHSSSILLSSPPTLALPPPPIPPTTKPQAPAAAAVPSMPASNPLPNTLLGASHFSTVLSAAAAMAASTTTMAAAALPQGIASSQTMNLIVPSFSPSINPTALPPSQATNNPTVIPANVTSSFPSFSPDLISNSTSSSTSSDVEIQGRHRRKRKWKDFFERLMTEVVQKQEEMQKRFLEAIEKREHERMVREETWRMQELARINREREILAQERSIAAAKDAAVMAFLQKLSEQQNPGQAQPQQNNPPPTSQPQPPPPQAAPPSPLPAPIPAASAPAPATTSQLVLAPVPALPQPLMTASTIDTLKSGNGDHQNFLPTSSSRWPKEEIQALINLRTNLDSKYQENTPKGPLWEEISAGMRKLGYNRNSKRCKEKWENINKYFKKVKESNKKRPEDSKTCPYFHQLDALYKERNKNNDVIDIGGGVSSSNLHFKPENSVPLMVMPEQQWPPAGQEHRPGSVMEDLAAEDHQDDDDDDKDNEDDDEDEAGGYEIVANKSASISTV